MAVQDATAGIGSGFPANIQNGVATVNADITGPRLKNLHNTLSPQAPQDELAVIANYGAVISDMINLADQTAQGVSDAGLTSDVRAFNALALAKEQLSQQRALLNYSFSDPGGITDPANVFVDPNTELALQIASQEEFSDESAFQQAATPAERAFLASALSSTAAATSVAAAQNIETNVIANEGSVTGQSGSPLGLSILGAEDSTSTTPTAADLSGGARPGTRAWAPTSAACRTPRRCSQTTSQAAPASSTPAPSSPRSSPLSSPRSSCSWSCSRPCSSPGRWCSRCAGCSPAPSTSPRSSCPSGSGG